MRKFGLIGYPLGHSFSKIYFTQKFQNEHILDCSYENFPLQDIGQIIKLVSEDQNLCGFNVTIPYKSEIIRFLDSLETEAKNIGAVNVVKIKRTGGKIKLSGYNSDVTGIIETLSPYVSKNVKNAIVFGTGGSSKAVCYALNKFGINIFQISRNKGPGLYTYSEITPDLIDKCELIINTTPLGMFPKIEGKPDIDYNLLSPKHILFDLVYNPEITAFLKMGIEKGCTTIGGIKMLHAQAERAWEIWNDDNDQD
jgi:shikimate dehydrogenase